MSDAWEGRFVRTAEDLDKCVEALETARNAIAIERAARERAEEALRYIAGFDVAGYDAHMRPEEVALTVLGVFEAGSAEET
jgi:hypothetical protein